MSRRNLNDDNGEVFERYVVPTLKVLAVVMILAVAVLVLFVK